MDMLLTPTKIACLLEKARSVAKLDGCIVELGVYQGGALLRLAEANPDAVCFGFDTFEGMPLQAVREIDFHKAGEFGDTTYEAVRAALPWTVTLIKGLFPNSGVNFEHKIKFAHVDMDLEKSTADAIVWLKSRMVSGGVVVFDDYRWKNCAGVAKAIEAAGLHVRECGSLQACWIAP